MIKVILNVNIVLSQTYIIWENSSKLIKDSYIIEFDKSKSNYIENQTKVFDFEGIDLEMKY